MSADFLKFHLWEPIHFFYRHALVYVAYSLLKRDKLLVSHYIRVYLFAKKVRSLFSNIKLVHPYIIHGHHWVNLVGKHLPR